MISPSISIVMPTYNAEKYVAEAIESILNQSFTDFEFIIINDESTDGSLEIIQSYTDMRIKLVDSKKIGQYAARNLGHSMAKGKYICVMDADDVSLPCRLERQFSFMEKNPEVGIAGSGFRYLGTTEDILRENDYELLKVKLLRNNYFIHPSLIIRREFMEKYNLHYNEKYYYAADYDLLVRASKTFKITNMLEVLLLYRQHETQITSQHHKKQANYATDIKLQQVTELGMEFNNHIASLYLKLINGNPIDFRDKKELQIWISKILKSNQEKKVYHPEKLDSFFNALLDLQLLIKETPIIQKSATSVSQTKKTDLTDLTFLFPVRIDSQERQENIDAVVRFINYHFRTNIIILEADKAQQYKNEDNISCHFAQDFDPVFHRTKYINRLIELSNTSYVAVWDADVIASTEQIVDALQKLRSKQAIMSLPYNGMFYETDRLTSCLFKTFQNLNLLKQFAVSFDLMHGYYSVGGGFLINKFEYINAGGENENFYGWGLEDAERVKRMEILNLPIYRSEGPMFHLWHPKTMNSRFANKEIERKNREEFLKTCAI